MADAIRPVSMTKCINTADIVPLRRGYIVMTPETFSHDSSSLGYSNVASTRRMIIFATGGVTALPDIFT